VFRVGKLRLIAQVQLFYNLARPDVLGRWTTRVQLQFLFPKPK
jgi:hypothetical protein